MGYAELNGKYQRLRSELDAAYARPIWNSSRIDEIAEQIIRVERALASSQREVPEPAGATSPGANERGRDHAASIDS